MAKYVLNGLEVDKWITECNATYRDTDSENTKRNVKHVLMRDRVRTNVKEYQLKFGPMPKEDLNKILNSISPVFFEVNIGGVKATVYASDRSWQDMTIPKGWVSDLSFSLIER